MENMNVNKVISSKRYNKFRSEQNSPDPFEKGHNAIDSYSKFLNAYAKSGYVTKQEKEAIQARNNAIDNYKKKYGSSADLFKTINSEEYRQ